MKYLLGATKYNEIAFADVRIYDDERIGISFDTVRPFKVSEIDENYVEEWLSLFGKEDLYNLCEIHDCAPSELAATLLEDEDIDTFVDTSLYNEQYTINGEDWCFESGSCGQHDTRDEMAIIINRNGYDKINALWDTYHLKKMDNHAKELLVETERLLSEVDAEEWIKDYIRYNF